MPETATPYKNPTLDAKWRKAVAHLGKRWIMHRDYVFEQKHSFDHTKWWDNRLLQEGR